MQNPPHRSIFGRRLISSESVLDTVHSVNASLAVGPPVTEFLPDFPQQNQTNSLLHFPALSLLHEFWGPFPSPSMHRIDFQSQDWGIVRFCRPRSATRPPAPGVGLDGSTMPPGSTRSTGAPRGTRKAQGAQPTVIDARSVCHIYIYICRSVGVVLGVNVGMYMIWHTWSVWDIVISSRSQYLIT